MILILNHDQRLFFASKVPFLSNLKIKNALLIFKVKLFSVLNGLASNSLFLGMDELCCELPDSCRAQKILQLPERKKKDLIFYKKFK
jgi:hypothetical protein